MDADQLAQIERVANARCKGSAWERGEGEKDLALLAEVRRLQDGIRASCEWWDATRPDAPAFEVTNDFRRLLRGSPDGR